jgi:hypothetical protein
MRVQFKRVEGVDRTDRSVMIAEELRRGLFERILGGLQLAQICSQNSRTAAGERREFYLEQLEKVKARLSSAIQDWPDD